MREVTADAKRIACCGLYCGACRAYLKERCPGCRENVKATWCKVRRCCLGNDQFSCADCLTYPDLRRCAKFHNLFSRAVGFLLHSDRPACIERIRAIGPDAYAAEMAARRAQTIRR